MHDHIDSTQATRSSVLYLGVDPDLPKRMAPLLAAQGIELHTADERDGQVRAGPGPNYLALVLDTALLMPGQTLKTWLDALEADGVKAQHLLIIGRTKEIGPLVAVSPPGRHCLEVLLRLTEEDGALIPSRDFLPIAERSGRTLAIDRWMMIHSLAVLARQSQACPDRPGLGQRRALCPGHTPPAPPGPAGLRLG